MALRTSVTSCISLLGIVSVATGCSGQAPGQAQLARLGLSGGTGATLARQLAATPGGADKAKAAIAEAAQALQAAKPEDAQKIAALAQLAAAATVPPKDAAPGATTEAKAPTTADAPKPEVAPVVAEAPKPEAPAAAKPEAAPALAFPLGGLLAAVMPGADAEADDAEKVLFHDGFDEGLASWVSRGLGQTAAVANPDTLVLAGTKARKSLWIKTRTEIDLAASSEPRLRLDFKGAPVTLKAVWETDAGSFPEEILLTAVETEKDAAPEFDLSDLRGRPGHLVLVARNTKGGEAPVLDAVTIYDAQLASR